MVGRRACLALLALPLAAGAQPAERPRLATPAAREAFRAWMTLLIQAQLERGPTPRWQQRDCAGLVRFAVAEALRPHDLAWRRANGLASRPTPPDVADPAAATLRHAWRRADGSQGAYASALDMVQANTRAVGRALHQAAPGDLLFYDQGDDQHLMVWLGRYVAYHTGSVRPGDDGLRAVRAAELARWRDTRWRPVAENPNFAGIYRLDFL